MMLNLFKKKKDKYEPSLFYIKGLKYVVLYNLLINLYILILARPFSI